MTDSTIIYTHTDEAPALATRSFLPIVKAITGPAGVDVETRDISLTGRILSQFNDLLPPEQQVSDALAELGELATSPAANIIKLPNISASVPQLRAAVKELQAAGFAIPDYPDEASTPEEADAKARFAGAMGSAVNPVLRQGNSDRRAPMPVKQFARKNPHPMGAWSADSKTHVATMDDGDFRTTERSTTFDTAQDVRIEHVASDGTVTVLKDGLAIEEGEVIDAAVMRRQSLLDFLAAQIADAKEQGVLFSLHLKATMMKVSDPIIFGHAVTTFFSDLFERYGDVLVEAGANVRDGFGDVVASLDNVAPDTRADIETAIAAALADGPALAMVDSDRGITNLHVPSDVIVDASMPAMIRTSGQMWNAAGEQQDTKATIPDSSYADVYETVIEDCKVNGAYDPTTMGTVPNVGLMARKAEEYGSHDKTFEMSAAGSVRVVDTSGATVLEHDVAEGDLWRMCQTKDDAIRDWVKLAVTRARATGSPAVFWLDETRGHDAELIAKVRTYLADHDTAGLQIEIMNVRDATSFSLERIRRGEDTISVTGNVLRDYLTDLFPILEVGTSAKMLSIVPLLNGGGLFETGAGGSAPKHVQQFEKENHLRWDSLGEFLALAVSLDHYAGVTGNAKARILGKTLDDATAELLETGKSPSRKVNEIDNRGSHFYLALAWARALAGQTEDAELAAHFAPLAEALAANEDTIATELIEVQGQPMDIGGYYLPDEARAVAAMRPSPTLNAIIDSF
ncbi:MAG TPA: NADP-dependent isocitrate dehydrogenase [Acidimicrobiales bacterium]|nr:NADP-dependent isocitrate dehydrogenase [Acidimicrobiales bacterium]